MELSHNDNAPPCIENKAFEVQMQSGTLSIETDMPHSKITELLSFASRYNEKRQFLFASNILGKYIPAEPKTIDLYQEKLISELSMHNEVSTFIGFAESACGLGEAIFNKTMDKFPYLIDKSAYTHTTRQFDDSEPTIIEFIEPHSHASDQVLLKPLDSNIERLYNESTCLVVIEDEITTGNTLINFVAEYLKVNHNIRRLKILTYVDWRTEKQKIKMADRFSHLDIQTHSLLSGTINYKAEKENTKFQPLRNKIHALNNKDKTPKVLEAKYGIFHSDRDTSLAIETIKSFTNNLEKPILIVATSEFSFWPQKVALELANMGGDVLNLSTTRAPLQLGNDIHSKTVFESHYADSETHYLYNLCTDRVVFFAYETFSQAKNHRDLLQSLGANIIVMEAE
jgi:hypothetical protein